MTKQSVINALKSVLADSYALYLKTQNYHWNVEGARFKELHEMFEQQYTDLALAVDEIAELIRALGAKAPGTWGAYAELTKIKDGNENADDLTMVSELSDDQEVIQGTLKSALDIAQKSDDDVVADALIRRMTVHRKNHWMLSSTNK